MQMHARFGIELTLVFQILDFGCRLWKQLFSQVKYTTLYHQVPRNFELRNYAEAANKFGCFSLKILAVPRQSHTRL